MPGWYWCECSSIGRGARAVSILRRQGHALPESCRLTGEGGRLFRSDWRARYPRWSALPLAFHPHYRWPESRRVSDVLHILSRAHDVAPSLIAGGTFARGFQCSGRDGGQIVDGITLYSLPRPLIIFRYAALPGAIRCLALIGLLVILQYPHDRDVPPRAVKAKVGAIAFRKRAEPIKLF
eukprot:scaffold208199_cov26-Tisochrysis_lutea.AAC.2